VLPPLRAGCQDADDVIVGDEAVRRSMKRRLHAKTSPELARMFDEANADIRQVVLCSLQEEVARYKIAIRSTPRRDAFGRYRCMLCPFRAFASARRLRRHVDSRHTRELSFVASGTKQLAVVWSLADECQVSGKRIDGLLARSAGVMAATIIPPITHRVTEIDRHIVLLLHSDGPQYMAVSCLPCRDDIRRVGYTYYTGAFAQLLFKEALLAHGRLRPTAARVAFAVLPQCAPMLSLLPRPGEAVWLKLMEDVLASPIPLQLRRDAMDRCASFGEFQHITLDATIRVLRRARGQADYRASAEERSLAAIPDQHALRRILTVMGRTSTPLGTILIRSENAQEVAAALKRVLTDTQLAMVESVASDAPSAVLFAELKQVCPRLRTLAVDPLHLAMVYEHCFFRRKTPGSRCLRTLLAKFGKHDPTKHGDHWGPPYTGHGAEPLDAYSARRREEILSPVMSEAAAQHIIAHVNPSEPWASRRDFVEAMAALRALFPSEVVRRSHVMGKSLFRLMYAATAPSKLEWYLNNQRALHHMPLGRRGLVAMGTTANEAMHHEINAWFRTVSVSNDAER
jgi:hypothetical protein